jgi:hypothetical protein
MMNVNNTSDGIWLVEEEEQIPALLYAVMGIWATITGLTGFFANSVAIGLFCTSSKVSSTQLWVYTCITGFF